MSEQQARKARRIRQTPASAHPVDHELDLCVFAARYRNDKVGAPAYDPALLLKIIPCAYSRGIRSSREIERAVPREYRVHGALRR